MKPQTVGVKRLEDLKRYDAGAAEELKGRRKETFFMKPFG